MTIFCAQQDSLMPPGLRIMRENAAFVAADPQGSSVEQIRDVACTLMAFIDARLAEHGVTGLDYGQMCDAVHDFVWTDDSQARGAAVVSNAWVRYEVDLVVDVNAGAGADRPVLHHPNLATAYAAAGWVLEQLDSLPNSRIGLALRRSDGTEPVFAAEGRKQHIIDEVTAWRGTVKRAA